MISLNILWTILLSCMILSAFFSSSETGMMALNRYRLKHASKTNKTAKRVVTMLKRPDRLLAVILIGNNFVNIAASAVATMIGLRLFGEVGVLLATIILTIAILIFCEITPKTLATIKPEGVAYFTVYPLIILTKILFPLVWIANFLTNSILLLIGIKQVKRRDRLTPEELRTLVSEAGGLIPSKHQEMLTSILDLESISVEDIMIPRTEIFAIDLNDDNEKILAKIKITQHTMLPVYENEIDDIKGIIHMRDVSRCLTDQQFSKQSLISEIKKPYYVPEGTPLHSQLINFQHTKNRMALVVDEYGDIIGLVTLADILEEIVGEFTTDVGASTSIQAQPDGSFIIDGSTNIRTLNQMMNWSLPTNGAKTISGLIIEVLEMIPPKQTCVLIANYPFEIMQVQDNMIKTCKISPSISQE